MQIILTVVVLALSLFQTGPADDPQVTIDPSKSEAIEVSQPESAAEQAAAEETGPVENKIEDFVPETGVESLDSGMNTFAKSVGGLIDGFISHLPTVVIALIVLIITAFLATFVAKIVRRVTKKVRIKQNLQDLFSKFAYIGVWFLGLIAAAGIVFPGLGMGELVATAGLASIAIGFAFQDIFENFLAGVLIIWRFPFNDGDFIEIPSQDVMGSVEEVQIRMTHIRSVSGELILVPNAMIYKNVVRVLTNRMCVA